MTEIIQQGDENSIYINSTMNQCIGEMEWRKNSFSDIFERSLLKAVAVKRLKNKKRRFDDGDINLGELLDEVDSL